MDSGMTTAERLCEKLNRLTEDGRIDLSNILSRLAFYSTPTGVEGSLRDIAAILDGDEQEGGEHG